MTSNGQFTKRWLAPRDAAPESYPASFHHNGDLYIRSDIDDLLFKRSTPPAPGQDASQAPAQAAGQAPAGGQGAAPLDASSMQQLLSTLESNPQAQDAFVQAMNGDQTLYDYMKQLDPTVKPQGQVGPKEVQKVLKIMKQDPNAQQTVIGAVQSDPKLAQIISGFQQQFGGGGAAAAAPAQ